MFTAGSFDLKMCVHSSYSNFILLPKQPHWGLSLCPLSKPRFQSAPPYAAKSRKGCIQGIGVFVGESNTLSEMAATLPRPLSERWHFVEQNSISVLSSHVQSNIVAFSSLWCPSLLSFPSLCPKYLTRLTSVLFPSSLDPTWFTFTWSTFACVKCAIPRL